MNEPLPPQPPPSPRHDEGAEFGARSVERLRALGDGIFAFAMTDLERLQRNALVRIAVPLALYVAWMVLATVSPRSGS